MAYVFHLRFFNKTTVETWKLILERPGFTDFNVGEVPPRRFGLRIICCGRHTTT